MKEGWEKYSLIDICNVTTGKHDANHAEMNGKYRFYTCSSQYVYCNTKRYEGECIILPGNGINVGESYYYNGEFDAYQRTYVIDKIDKRIIPMYLFYHLQNNWKSEGVAKQYGSATNYIKIGNFKDYIVKMPQSLSEQQSIVDYLDSAFAKIDAMKTNAENALNEAKALFQASLKEMLEPKEGWEEKKLGEVGTFIRGGNFSKKDFVEGGFPCIHYGQIHTKLGVATYKHLSCVPASMVKKDRCASRGDLVIAVTSEDDEGSCKCTAWMADYDAYVGGHAAILKHSLNPIFVSYYFKAARFQKAKLEYTHGFKVVEISPKDIAKIPIAYPSPSKQQSIVDTLDSLKSKVDRLQANYEKISQECDALKQAILRQVFE
ncbi:type I restriction enzyme, S subunit [Prevotella communis]|uniref:Type I restriction enzyme, S subunit n=1 Tax=Prevotella communis TaxID=2913614 RepID=A0A1H0E971_9BACT|nr:restriction endonuclease subunit S [Prevotella communis]SDN78997.1 type I restriction enzyme, S subunit [Prevotella communis]